MIGRLLRVLGVEDERPETVTLRFPPTEAEQRYECVRREAEQVITRADRETALSTGRLLSWEDLYDPGRRR